jgi:hypothetical protein
LTLLASALPSAPLREPPMLISPGLVSPFACPRSCTCSPLAAPLLFIHTIPRADAEGDAPVPAYPQAATFLHNGQCVSAKMVIETCGIVELDCPGSSSFRRNACACKALDMLLHQRSFAPNNGHQSLREYSLTRRIRRSALKLPVTAVVSVMLAFPVRSERGDLHGRVSLIAARRRATNLRSGRKRRTSVSLHLH